MSLKCDQCTRTFTIKSNLTRHLRMVHNLEVKRVDILPGDFDLYHYKCLEGCNLSFKYNRELRKHLNIGHNLNIVELQLEFPNSEAFTKWLRTEESENYVQYVHQTATKRKTTGTETFYYECNRTGKRNYVAEGVRKRKSRKWVAKLNRGCTSQIIVNKAHNGTFSVLYYKTHYGHDQEVEHIKLSKQDRATVTSKLLLGLPVSSVLNSAKSPKGTLKRINLIERKDIINIKKLFEKEPLNLRQFLQECGSIQESPLLYSNIQDESDNICFILMTQYQSKVLASAQILVLDSIFLKNCNFELVLLFAVTKTKELFPVASMFADKANTEVYKLFFGKIKERLGRVRPAVLVTNCKQMFEEIWLNVMGKGTICIYNPFQIEADWKLKLNQVVCRDLQTTKNKKRGVLEILKNLQKTTHDSYESFQQNIDSFQNDKDLTVFVEEFIQDYSDCKKWTHYNINNLNLPMAKLEGVTDVLRQYLNQQTEVRFDAIFHSFIRFIRDETINYLINCKITQRSSFLSENETKHNMTMSFNVLFMGENTWKVSSSDDKNYIVQKYSNRKCCNLICPSCMICVHCLSCTCLDFFLSNTICVHIHHIWTTFCQSLIAEPVSDEEIIIQVEEDTTESLKNEIIEKSTLLCENITKSSDKNTLDIILATLNQLCDLSAPEETYLVLEDHSYL